MNGNMQIRMYISNLGNDILGQGKLEIETSRGNCPNYHFLFLKINKFKQKWNSFKYYPFH